MDRPSPPANSRTRALVGAGVAVALFGLIASFEGKSNVGYRDVIGVATTCFGDTDNVVVGKRYSDAECIERLDRQIAAHAAPVLEITPGLRAPERRNQLIAAVSLTYNIGAANYRKSTVARRFSAGDWRGGCDAILAWNRAGGRVIQGLVRRREAEREICLKGLSK